MNKLIKSIGLAAIIAITGFSCANTEPEMIEEILPIDFHPNTDAYDGWKLGSQAYTFNRFTFFEAVDKVASLGLDWIEAYPGQRLAEEYPDARMSHSMSPEHRKAALKKLKDAGVTVINYGVVGLSDNEERNREIFDFAKEMGIETIVSEPKEEVLDLVDKLAQEYEINVAIHNHPEPSHYWDPEIVLAALKGRSKWIGANADTGHWMRSGVNPVEALKKLEGKITSIHFKDLNEFGNKEAHDVPWGSGKADVKALLTELHRQNYKGVFSIEYEYNWENSLPEIRPSVAYFNEVAASLNPSGWKNVFADDLSNAKFKEGSWTYIDGVLARVGGSYLWTNERYSDFILDVEYMVSEGANSGVFFRVDNLDNFVQTSFEVQVHETTDDSKYGMNGAMYDLTAPLLNVSKKAGEWNHYTITAKDNMIYVVHNDNKIIKMDVNEWVEARYNPDGTQNKFKTPIKDFVRSGFIGFQDHGQPVWFRNIKIRELKPTLKEQ